MPPAKRSRSGQRGYRFRPASQRSASPIARARSARPCVRIIAQVSRTSPGRTLRPFMAPSPGSQTTARARRRRGALTGDARSPQPYAPAARRPAARRSRTRSTTALTSVFCLGGAGRWAAAPATGAWCPRGACAPRTSSRGPRRLPGSRRGWTRRRPCASGWKTPKSKSCSQRTAVYAGASPSVSKSRPTRRSRVLHA